jgi:Txe/YoeB family toxin of toxin-antitoxin system
VSYTLIYSNQAKKDARKLKKTHLVDKAKQLLEIVHQNPFTDPPPFESLVGDLKGAYSRRINIQHRLVYSVDESRKTIKVLRLWSHYQ